MPWCRPRIARIRAIASLSSSVPASNSPVSRNVTSLRASASYGVLCLVPRPSTFLVFLISFARQGELDLTRNRSCPTLCCLLMQHFQKRSGRMGERDVAAMRNPERPQVTQSFDGNGC